MIGAKTKSFGGLLGGGRRGNRTNGEAFSSVRRGEGRFLIDEARRELYRAWRTFEL